ncbi:hypothetical protein BDZ91DRAFT_728247, partial [Kalaharituber pfeilii]
MHYSISELMPRATVLNNCSELIPHSTVPQYPPLPRANTIRYSIELCALWSLNTPLCCEPIHVLQHQIHALWCL